MESQMDSPRKACGFPQRTDLRPALRVHSLPTPGAYGWKPLRAFHTAPCRVASAARFIAKIFPTLRNRPRRNSYTTRWDAGGESYSWLITDVMNPIVKDTRTGFSPLSGQTDKWAGVASDYIAVGTRGVLQGGAVLVSGAPAGSSLTTPEIHTIRGTASQRFPKPRVWRTVH